MTLIFSRRLEVVKIRVRAAVLELSCKQSFDDAENNTAVASAAVKRRRKPKIGGNVPMERVTGAYFSVCPAPTFFLLKIGLKSHR